MYFKCMFNVFISSPLANKLTKLLLYLDKNKLKSNSAPLHMPWNIIFEYDERKQDGNSTIQLNSAQICLFADFT